MKKTLTILSYLLLSLGFSGATLAKSVDERTAKTIGANCLISLGVPGVQSSADLVTAYVATATVNGAQVVDFYVFNVAGAKGFVFISGDDRVIPILAHSSESNFDIANIAPATRDWIEGYQNQITYVIEHNIPAKEGTQEWWSKFSVATKPSKAERTTVTFPLCQTLWDQAPGYNADCPNCTVGCATSGLSVTGCVATAMAQVMKYWNWPKIGNGLHTYTQNPNPNDYAAQTADFGNTAYNWTEMNGHLTNSCAATDTLMFHCGVAVEMNYDPNESGSYVTESEIGASGWPYPTACAEYALKNYFHYKRSLHGELRSGISGDIYSAFHIPSQAAYAESAWISMLQTELNAGHPILYKGQGSDGGHCWVCDGVETTTPIEFHFNWGWSGASNGYYTVDNLAPPALGVGGGGSGNNFNTDQGVIIGIVPDSFPNYTEKLEMASHLDCQINSPINYLASTYSVTAKVTNTGTTAFTGSFCVQVFDTLNNLAGTLHTLTGQSIAAGATSGTLTFGATAGLLAMIPGPNVYRLMYQPTGSTTWTPVGNNGVFLNFNQVDVRLSNEDLELYAPTVVTTGTTMHVGAGMWVNATIFDFDPFDFSGSLQAILVNTTTGSIYTVQTHTGESIASFHSITLSFAASSTTAPIGEYVLAIQHEPNGTGGFVNTGSDYYENPIIVHIINPAGVATPSAPAADISVYPNPANDVVNVAKGANFLDEIRVCDIQGREVFQMQPDNSLSVISIPVNNLAAGIYLVQLQTGGDVVTKKIVINR